MPKFATLLLLAPLTLLMGGSVMPGESSVISEEETEGSTEPITFSRS